MKNLFYLLLFCACSTGKMMNADSFCNVMMGMSEKEVVAVAGAPYSTCKNKDGSIEYEYIERFDGYNMSIMQVTYFIKIKNGKVVHKRSEKTYPPLYEYGALDYQSKNTDKDEKDPR